MFRVVFFVEDKALAEVMHAVSGKAKNLEVQPVVNAQAAPNGKIVQAAGSNLELIFKEITKHKLKQVTSTQMRAIVKGIGLSPASWNHFCQEFRKQGFLKNTATKGLYDVVSK